MKKAKDERASGKVPNGDIDSKTKRTWIPALTGAIVVLMAAFAMGLAVKNIRTWLAETKPKSQAEPQPEKSAQLTDAEWDDAMSDATEEGNIVVQEPNEQVKDESGAKTAKEPDNAPRMELAGGPAQMPQGFGGWQQGMRDLNFTEEEKARLAEGFRLMMQRWQNMTPEQMEAEKTRMMEIGQRWQNMSDEERQATMGRMRERFEEWRQSGSAELPNFSLD
jgi:hypothetical protein